MISDILSITEFLISHADSISQYLIVGSILFSIIIGAAEYKIGFFKLIWHHRNKWWFVYLFLTLSALLILKKYAILSGAWLIVCTALWIAYGVLCLLSLKPKVFRNFSDPVLRYYERYLYTGSAIEQAAFFRAKRPWYLWTREDKLEYQMLSVMFFQEIGEFQNAYKAFEQIDPRWVYPGEKKDFDIYKAILLVQMGSIKTATGILGEPKENKSTNPTVWMAYAFIAEHAGDMDAAYSYCEKAKTLMEMDSNNLTDAKQGEIYNNFYRYALIKGNDSEALYSINRAWEMVKRTRDMRILSIVASNRIMRMAIIGKSVAECERALKEYLQLVPENDFANQIEVGNCEICLYRQFGDEKKVFDLIRDDYLKIIQKLSPSQKFVFTQSTFVMLMNGHYDFSWILPYISTDEKEYAALSVMDRLLVFKGYMGIFQQESFRTICKQPPFRELRQIIMAYYEEKALGEIEEMLAQVESYNVFQYMDLTLQKLGILKLLEGKDHIKNSEKKYVDLYQELYEKGLHIDAIRVLTIMIDECSSPYTILLWSPSWQGHPPMLYSECIECSVPPDPILLGDGLHLQYPKLILHPGTQIHPLQDQVIRKYIDIVLDEMKKWKNHPAKIDLSAEIAHVLLCIGRKAEAREIFEFFTRSGVSIHQFSSWMKEEMQALSKELYE